MPQVVRGSDLDELKLKLDKFVKGNTPIFK